MAVTHVSSLRRRNVSVTSNSHIALSPNNNISNCAYRSLDQFTGDNEALKVQNLRKYPKLTMSYPKILQNDKVYLKDIKRTKHTSPIFLKPPYSQPPVFLKCKIKNPSGNKEIISDKSDEINTSVSQTTDLDIQFSKFKLESVLAPDLSLETKKNNTIRNSNAQTLKQYCNFEEKKVMRVAPHIRRKDVICDTVDAWSHDSFRHNIPESSKYKPLVFGGTYPIDVPLRHGNSNDLIQDRNNLIKKDVSFTYDIDIPTKCD